jgi:hypothetical protein
MDQQRVATQGRSIGALCGRITDCSEVEIWQSMFLTRTSVAARTFRLPEP